MRILKPILFLLLILLGLVFSCEDYADHQKFQRPDWVPGKVFTTAKLEEDLSLFTACLERAGLDTVLDVSGTWTIFAPSDEAMARYLTEHNYDSVSDIPLDELERITEFQIVQNPWSTDQLHTLGAEGWRAEDVKDSYYYSFKRQTIFRNPIKEYWIHKERNKKEMIVNDSSLADASKKVNVESRKYVPIFYDEYFGVNGLSSDDYSFYFDRPYEYGNVFYAGAKIIKGDIFAENGFVHITDKVIEPLPNAMELLSSEMPGESYQLFLDLVNWYYPHFEPNMKATMERSAFVLGGYADTIWDLSYVGLEDDNSDDLAFDLQKELIGYNSANINETMVRHNGLFIPTDEAFMQFLDDRLTSRSGIPEHWKDERDLPKDIVDIIFKRHFISTPIYPSSAAYRNIFWEDNGFKQNEGDIIRKEFCSNATFIGIDSYSPDRVFTSVTGPVFCRPEYTRFRRALIYARLDDDIAYNDGPFCFFPIRDGSLAVDSSLFIEYNNQEQTDFDFFEYSRQDEEVVKLNRNKIANRLRGQVALAIPTRSANKEFLPAMNGNYIIWDNARYRVQGTSLSTKGYDGKEKVISVPAKLDEKINNGEVYRVNYWFQYKNTSMRNVLRKYTKFYNLLDDAGLYDSKNRDFNFINYNYDYTIFIPTDDALDAYQADTLTKAELRDFLKYHFVKGAMIFTDNKMPSDIYYTASDDIIRINTGIDVIEILNYEGEPYCTVKENESTTNIMAVNGGEVYSVAHVIDTVLLPLTFELDIDH